MRETGPEPAPGPLAALSRLLRGASPPRLSHLVALFGEAEDYGEFTRLVREFLPDLELDILGRGTLEGMGAFARAFRERYFPLAHVEGGGAESLEDLTRFIPIHTDGLDYSDYHTLNEFRLGVVLASLLVDFEGEMGMEGEGIRITLLEEAARKVPQDFLGRIPEGGYPRDFLEEKLPGTPYQGLIAHARWLCHDTGSWFLDLSCEEVFSDPPEWTRDMVEAFTEHWRHAQDISEEADIFCDWLEEDPQAHLAEVLDFLERRWRGKHRERG